MHELWSYANGESSVRDYLKEKYRQLRRGGRLVIRDVVGPDHADEIVLLWCNRDDGKPSDRTDPAILEERTETVLGRLSTEDRFHLFVRDFLRNKPKRKAELVHFQQIEMEGRTFFRLSRQLAGEFLSKKDYIDNWNSETNEEFCFWDFTRWKQELAEIGFQVVETFSHPNQGSRVYCNPWTVEHRYKGSVELLRDGAPHQLLEFPPTNMVLVAEK